MRRFALAGLLLLVAAGCAKEGDGLGGPVAPATPERATAPIAAMWRSQFEAHQAQWAAEIAGPDSPLPEDKRAGYDGLRFYAFDPEWRFVGDLERLRPPRGVDLRDNRGKMQVNVEYGRIGLVARGDTAWLTVYRPVDHPEQYFIPFRDSTSEGETYGGGRFVHLDSLDTHRFVLDFNKSYNPYCAYDTTWVCPLPPSQNTLPFAVRAGMMAPAEGAH